MNLHSENRNLLYRVTEWMGKKLSPQKNKPNHWLVWGPTRAGMTEIDPKLDEYKRFCSENADVIQKNIRASIYVRTNENGDSPKAIFLAQSDLSQIRKFTNDLSEEEKKGLLENAKILIRRD